MNLYLLRHAKAVERGHRHSADAGRPLTEKGASKMRRIASSMLDRDLCFDRIYASTYRRARETAEIVADIYSIPERLELSPLLEPEGDPGELIGVIGRRRPPFDNVLLVGHEPYLSRLISVLVTGHEGCSLAMKKGGLCKLSADALEYGRCATLEWLMGPDQLLGSG